MVQMCYNTRTMRADKIDCEMLAKEKVDPLKVDGNDIMILYTALAFLQNERKLFEDYTGGSICHDCWKRAKNMTELFLKTLESIERKNGRQT